MPHMAPDPAPTTALAAILTGGLRLALQPVRPARRPDLVSFEEGLARVMGLDGAVIAAGAFAEALERRGLAPALDRAALACALDLLSRDRGARISVNVSARTVGDRRWMAGLEAAALADPDLVRRLIVEMTETARADRAAARIFRDRLAEMGAAFALDDFGSGFADAAQTLALRPDILKLDRSLCRQAETPEGARAVASALALARRIEALTVGEGVETAEMAERLADLGVDALQGHWCGAPALAVAA